MGEQHYRREMQDCGLDASDGHEQHACLMVGGFRKFPFKGALIPKQLSEFLSSDNLTEYIRSERPPATQNGAVRTVVGTSWRQEVDKASIDTVMLFHSSGDLSSSAQ